MGALENGIPQGHPMVLGPLDNVETPRSKRISSDAARFARAAPAPLTCQLLPSAF